MSSVEFAKWPKIKRYENETCTITEKVDGTNGQFFITEDNEILVGARNGWITVDKDNFGFAAWIQERKDIILKHFPVGHRFYGEFYGKGINRGYGLEERRFALFRLADISDELRGVGFDVVPVIRTVITDQYLGDHIYSSIMELDIEGSKLVPGYNNPEGVIVQLALTGTKYKVFCVGNRDK